MNNISGSRKLHFYKFWDKSSHFPLVQLASYIFRKNSVNSCYLTDYQKSILTNFHVYKIHIGGNGNIIISLLFVILRRGPSINLFC